MTTQIEKTSTPSVPPQRFTLYVAGWMYSRRGMIKDGKLYMEVAMASCSHCSTCSRRIQFIGSQLSRSKISWQFAYIYDGVYVEIEFGGQPSDVSSFLTDLFGVQVHRDY